MQKITPFLWFDGNAEEAMHFYTAIFPDAKVGGVTRYGDAGPGPKGSVMTAEFELAGQHFVALNGGPHFKFTPAISFFVRCTTQEEVDYYWTRLGDGGQTSQCGWLQDKYGLSWQIIPDVLMQFHQRKDPVKAARAMKAMLGMTKLDIAALQRAYDG